MMLSTLRFLVTTPEAWREGPGGIPQLSVLGENLLKDTVILGAALPTVTKLARQLAHLERAFRKAAMSYKYSVSCAAWLIRGSVERDLHQKPAHAPADLHDPQVSQSDREGRAD